MQRSPGIRSVLILDSDRLHSRYAQVTVGRVFPTASIQMVSAVDEATSRIQTEAYDLLVTGLTAQGGDIFEFLWECTQEPRVIGQIVVITTRREPQVLATIGSLPRTGVFDLSCEPPENLVVALHAATGPAPYWSESLLAARWESEGLCGCACPTLTNRERIVFSVIGDGRHDASAAEVLGLSTYTVQSARRSIYRKLGIDNKGELVRRAAETGFVLIGAGGVVRPGFSQLANAQLQNRSKIVCGDLDVRENALSP